MTRYNGDIRLTRAIAEDMARACVTRKVVYTSEPFTFVGVTSKVFGKTYHGAGCATCDDVDTFDTEAGERIAEKRAVRAIVKRLMVRHRYLTHDDVLEVRRVLGSEAIPPMWSEFVEAIRRLFDPLAVRPIRRIEVKEVPRYEG